MVQAGQTGEVLLGDGWGGLGSNQAVGVSWVAHNKDLIQHKCITIITKRLLQCMIFLIPN